MEQGGANFNSTCALLASEEGWGGSSPSESQHFSNLKEEVGGFAALYPRYGPSMM
jgi:hypothetical protein